MYRYAVAAVLIASFSTASLAADEYFVVQDPSTKKCKTRKKMPDGETLIVIGASSYKTIEEAKAAKKAAPECQKPKAQ